mgnify:CR=1 FL=1
MQGTTRIQVQVDDSPTLGPQFQEWKLNCAIYSSILQVLQVIL